MSFQEKYRLNYRDTRLLIAAALPYSLALAILIPLTTLTLERWGYNRTIIGITTAIIPLAIICTAPLTPWFGHRIGTKNAMLSGLLTIATSIGAMGWSDNLIAWIILRFLIGAGLALYLVFSESQLINLTYGPKHGFLMGMYTACFCIGFTAGPLILSQIGDQGILPFGVCAGFVLLAMLILLSVNKLNSFYQDRLSRGIGIRAMMKRSPLAVGAAISSGMMELAIYSFFPLYGLDHGLTAMRGVMLLAVFSFGGGILQPLIGWSSEKIKPHQLSMLFSLTGCAIPLVLAAFMPCAIVMIIVLIVWGGIVYGLFTLSLLWLGRTFLPHELAYAHAMLLTIYGISSITGPIITGSIMDWQGSKQGFALALFITVIPLLVFFKRS